MKPDADLMMVVMGRSGNDYLGLDILVCTAPHQLDQLNGSWNEKRAASYYLKMGDLF